MPDMQKCTGIYRDEETGKTEVCGAKEECYRHTAESLAMQAWMPSGKDFQADDGCDNYIPNSKYWSK